MKIYQTLKGAGKQEPYSREKFSRRHSNGRTVELTEKDFKINTKNMFKDLKENMNIRRI